MLDVQVPGVGVEFGSGTVNREPGDQHPATGLPALNLLDWPDVVGFLQQLAALSAALVPRTSCGVTMHREQHQAATVGSSDEFAMLLGEIQYGRGQGPCLQALRTGKRVKVPDLATDDRWGEYRLHALAAGVRSSVSLPLTVNDAPSARSTSTAAPATASPRKTSGGRNR